MAKRRRRKKKRSTGLGFTVVIAVFVLIYTIPRLINYTGSAGDSYVVATTGTIESAVSYEGVITREEQLFTSVTDGVVEYYYPGGVTLAANTVICSIHDSETYGDLIEEMQESVSEQIAALSVSESEYAEAFAELTESVEEEVESFQRTYDTSQFSQVYDLKEEMEAAVKEHQDLYSILSGTTVQALLEESEIYAEVEDDTTEDLWISQAGIISYAYDGYEGWDASMVESDFLSNYNSSYTYLNINLESVSTGDPLYRLVTSEIWYITLFLEADDVEAYELAAGDTMTVYEDDQELSAEISALEVQDDGTYKVIFSISEYMTDYMNQRTISISLEQGSYTGIKLPTSCLSATTFYYVPADCVYTSGDDSGVMVSDDSGDYFVAVDFVWSSDDAYYFSELPDGLDGFDTLLYVDSEETTYLQQTDETACVYIVNADIETMTYVEIIYQTDQYAIVSGIDAYDHVKILS